MLIHVDRSVGSRRTRLRTSLQIRPCTVRTYAHAANSPRERTLIGTLAPGRSVCALRARLDAEELGRRRRKTDLFDEIVGIAFFRRRAAIPPCRARARSPFPAPIFQYALCRTRARRGLFTRFVSSPLRLREREGERRRPGERRPYACIFIRRRRVT